MLRPLILSCATALALVPAVQPEASAPAARSEAGSRESDAQMLVFHAVLEGLYHDGVSSEVVDAITELDPDLKWPKHFIYACPICMPAFNAFRSYRARPVFLGDKQQRDTFGSGLDDELEEQLTAGDPKVRQAAIKDLVKTWIERRLTRDRLTKEELAEFRFTYEGYAEKGLAYLKSYQESERFDIYDHMEYCPLCAGATEAVGH